MILAPRIPLAVLAVAVIASPGCGGATEQALGEPQGAKPDEVAAPESTPPPAVEDVAPPTDEASKAEPPGEATGEVSAEASGEAPAEPSGEAPAEVAGEPPAQDAPGKGKESAVLGTDKGAKGVTRFEHWKHQRSGAKCVACHHDGAGRRSCGAGADCHKVTEVNAPSAKDAFHKACMPCHKKKGLPGGCDFCHQPKAAG